MDTKNKKIKGLIATPLFFLIVYLLANILPNILLGITEPFNLFGRITLILLPLGAYLILFSTIKNIGRLQLILFPLLFIHAFQIVIMYLFGQDIVAADMFLNLFTTNASEAGEVLAAIWPAVLFVCLVYIPTTLLAIFQWKKRQFLPITERKIVKYIGGVILLVGLGSFTQSQDKNTQTFSVHEDIYPTNVLYNLYFAIHKWDQSNKYPITSKNFSFDAVRTKKKKEREIHLLVIGETSRADNWQLYGYNRETTPLLNQRTNLIYFPDAITQSNTTHKSVSIMLSAASAENYKRIYSEKGILDAFKEVNFHTAFLSNQGENKTFTEYFGKAANDYINLRASSTRQGIIENHRDSELLPHLKEVIESHPTQDLFIVLHTYGSHFNYKERYPQEFSIFLPDDVTKVSLSQKEELINAYNNSILYTDFFLNEVISVLEKEDAITSLLYCSDHGEDLLDDQRRRFLHASPSPTYYQLKVPLFIWLSDSYVKEHPEKINAAKKNRDYAVATNSIYHTLLDIANIRTKNTIKELSLVSVEFKQQPRNYLNDHDQPIPYQKMNLKKEDFLLIKKNKMEK